MIGRTIGRYRIDAELGRGGMGVVYRATQTNLDRTVAIKMLSPHLAESGEYLARFRREAAVLAKLQHENIVHIYDVEEVSGTYCIVMEFVAGPSLGVVLAREGALPPGAVREIGVQLAAGLEAAHRKGIVHRDLKPDNVLFTLDGRPRITDFGIARIAGGDAMARTRTGILMGTPYYMSPEQARGGEVTGASDLYSLGVLLYQLLSGRVPFDGSDPISLALKHMQEPVPSLAETMPGLPGPLVALVGRALEKEPHRRFGSAAEMGMALSTLELEPSRSISFASDTGPGADAGGEPPPAYAGCPECGFRVHAAFVTCPQCALPLRATGGAGVADHPGVAPHEAWVEDVFEVAAPVARGAPPIAGQPDAVSAPAPAVAPVRLTTAAADGALPLAGGWNTVRDRILAWNTAVARWGRERGWLAYWPADRESWIRPRGRLGIPPIVWAGLIVVGLGVALGLMGNAAADRPPVAGIGGAGAITAPRLAGGGPTSGGSRPGASVSGSPVAPGGVATVDPGPGPGDPPGGDGRPDGPVDGTLSPEPGATDPENVPDDLPTSGTGDNRTPPVLVVPGDDRVAGEAIPVIGVGGRENLPTGFDIERARRELVAIVDRQRRSTEAGDGEMFVADLSPELTVGAADDLAGLHDAWTGVRSEMWNLAIYFEDSTRARVDFHTRITGVPARGGAVRAIQDTHVYWGLAYRAGRWVITEARSAPHDGDHG